MALPNTIIEPISYEFGPFRLEPVRRALQKDGGIVPLTAKAFDLLVILVENRDQPISKDELMQKVWPESKTVSDNSFSVTLSTVRKALGDAARNPHYIIRTSSGYCFVAEVRKIPANGERRSTETNVTAQEMSAGPGSFLGGHLRFVLGSGILYGLLYAVALLVEVAYRFDQYGRGALLRAPVVWLWAGAVSVSGLALDWGLTRAGRRGGLAASLTIALLGIGVLVAGVGLYLPPVPITQLDIQAYTAQAAYLKTVTYFLFLQFLFLLLPFHFVIVMQCEILEGRHVAALDLLTETRLSLTPRGVVFIRLRILALLLAAVVVVSLFLHHSLMGHLKPAQFMNLFANLILVRLILFNALGGVCLWWYYQALNELKREVLRLQSFQELLTKTNK